ncbi:Exocyst complex component 5, partial [Tieghemiomyces parasiticus]
MSPSKPRTTNQDAMTRHALTVHHFQSDFDAKDFFERVSGNLVLQSKRAAKPYDPQMFIQNFEMAAKELGKLQREIEQQMREVGHVAQASEVQYRTRVDGIRRAFRNIETNFEALESKVNGIGSTAIRVGEQLESIERERTRAADVEDLVEFFIEFGHGRSSRLEELLSEGGPEGQCKAAVITRRLNSIIQDGGDFGTSDRARINIEQFCERLERDLLDAFDRAYRGQDTVTMASCARALIEFNGGASCVQTYVNQHEFFMKMAETQTAVADQTYQALTGINDLQTAPPPVLDGELSTFYRSISKMLRHEWTVISAVFPNALAVMQVLVQRVFAQSLQNYLENLLHLAEHDGQLAYLRILAACHIGTQNLVRDLQQFDVDVMAPFFSAHDADQSPVAGTIAATVAAMAGSNSGSSAAASTAMLLDTQSAASFSVTLVRCMDDLFVPYIENQRYLDVEARFLLGAFQTLVSRFLAYAAQRKAARPKNVFARTINQFTGGTAGPTDPAGGNGGSGGGGLSPHSTGVGSGSGEMIAHGSPTPTGGSGQAAASGGGGGTGSNGGSVGGYSIPTFASSLAQFTSLNSNPTVSTNLGGPSPSGGGNGAAASPNASRKLGHSANLHVLTDAELDQEDTLPSVTSALQILKVHAEAVARCVELSLAADVPKHTVRLFVSLTDFLGTRYLDPALELALDELNDTPRGHEPDFRTFYTVRAGNQIIHLAQCHFRTAIAPLIAPAPSQYRDAVANKNDFTAALESRLNQLVIRQITAVSAHLAATLAKQRKSDYRPREEDFQAL